MCGDEGVDVSEEVDAEGVGGTARSVMWIWCLEEEAPSAESGPALF
jgi:hypothetical protein